MSIEAVKEILQNIEKTMHDRFRLVEELLASRGNSTNVPSDVHAHLNSLEEYTMGQIRTLAFNHDQLKNEVDHLNAAVDAARGAIVSLNRSLALIESKIDAKRVKDDLPVEAAEAVVELEAAQAEEDEDASHTETKAKTALAKAVEKLEEEFEEEEVEVEEQEEQEEEVEEEQEEEVEEEQEEEVELEFTEFTYKKKTYHHDQFNNVYIADEEGCIDPSEVVGIWNPQTKKIERVPEA